MAIRHAVSFGTEAYAKALESYLKRMFTFAQVADFQAVPAGSQELDYNGDDSTPGLWVVTADLEQFKRYPVSAERIYNSQLDFRNGWEATGTRSMPYSILEQRQIAREAEEARGLVLAIEAEAKIMYRETSGFMTRSQCKKAVTQLFEKDGRPYHGRWHQSAWEIRYYAGLLSEQLLAAHSRGQRVQ